MHSTFRCTNGDFYAALGSSMGLALLVWVGGGLLKRVSYFFGNEPSLGRKSLIPHLPRIAWLDYIKNIILQLAVGYFIAGKNTYLSCLFLYF